MALRPSNPFPRESGIPQTSAGETRSLPVGLEEVPLEILRNIPEPPSHSARAIHPKEHLGRPLRLGERSPKCPARFR